LFDPQVTGLPHPNTLDLEVLDAAGRIVASRRYLSVGGGFVEGIDEAGGWHAVPADGAAPVIGQPAHPFRNSIELLRVAKKERLTWSAIALENEIALTGRDAAAVHAGLDLIWSTMRACIRRGIEADQEERLPGPLNVRRRAKRAYEAAMGRGDRRIPLTDPVELMAHAYALAVNEENASGRQVVTAPTNGAAGVIPACFAAVQDGRGLSADDIRRGLLTAAVIGMIIKRTASLSGAEMGCQGEVGSACAMAAGGLVEMLGGTEDQVEMAAEIGIEHHLGMTCDPVAGLVQIPCIERNVMGAVKALNAATLALSSDGKHRITFDESLAAMRQIGLDMNAKYKETALGGLATVRSAPHHVEC
jgi:L-serine dehydratase